MTSPSAHQTLVELTYDPLDEYTSQHAPYEAVALVSSRASIRPLINQRRSKHSFAVSEAQIAEAAEDFSDAGEYPVAIFHSHPTQDSAPSSTDVEQMRQLGNGYTFLIMGIDGLAAWVWNDEDDSITQMGYVSHEQPDLTN